MSDTPFIFIIIKQNTDALLFTTCCFHLDTLQTEKIAFVFASRLLWGIRFLSSTLVKFLSKTEAVKTCFDVHITSVALKISNVRTHQSNV